MTQNSPISMPPIIHARSVRRAARCSVGIRYANSTIYGHAVYLMINGGQHKRVGATFPQVLVGGPIPAINVSPADPSKIKQVLAYGVWRLALYNHKFTGPNFRDHTVAAAFDLYGPATIVDTVDKAWQAVGIRHACSASPPIPSSYTIEPYFCGGGHRITWPAVPGGQVSRRSGEGWFPLGYGTDCLRHGKVRRRHIPVYSERHDNR